MAVATMPHLLSASSINSDGVKNPQGEDLGEIKDLMIDLSTGRVTYAVLSFGGFLGIGDKLFAIPWEALTVDTNKECLVLDRTKEQLEAAPGFDKDNWPDFSDPSYTSSVHSHYDVTPYWD